MHFKRSTEFPEQHLRLSEQNKTTTEELLPDGKEIDFFQTTSGALKTNSFATGDDDDKRDDGRMTRREQ